MLDHETIGEVAAARALPADGTAPAKVPTVGWIRAGLSGAVVFAYFVVATTWLPSVLIRLDGVASSPQWLRDAIATGSWLATLTAGMLGLRWAQTRGWI